MYSKNATGKPLVVSPPPLLSLFPRSLICFVQIVHQNIASLEKYLTDVIHSVRSVVFYVCFSILNPCVLPKIAPGKPEDELLARLLRVEKILSLQFPQYNYTDALPDYPLPTNHPFITLPSGATRKESEESEDEELKEEDKDRGRGRLTKGKWFGVVSHVSSAGSFGLDSRVLLWVWFGLG